jgi:hypothetical protein
MEQKHPMDEMASESQGSTLSEDSDNRSLTAQYPHPARENKTSKNAYINDRIPLEMWLQKYDDHGIPKATAITTQNRWSEIPKNDLIIYWPVCLESAVFDSFNFERLLRGTVEKFKKTKLHFAIIVTDEINRHNIAKRAPTPSNSGKAEPAGWTPWGSSGLSQVFSKFGVSYSAKYLTSNQNYIEEAQKRAELWRESVNLATLDSIKAMELKLGCKITLFDWDEIMKSPNLREVFCEKMGIVNRPTALPVDLANVDISYMAAFVDKVYKNKRDDKAISFRGAIEALLFERMQKDGKEFGLNAAKKKKFNKYYLLEETVGQMRVLALLGDLIDLYLHPELVVNSKRLAERQRISPEVEWHDWWARTLLGSLTNHNFLNQPYLYRFVSTVYFPTAIFKNTPFIFNQEQRKRSSEEKVAAISKDNRNSKRLDRPAPNAHQKEEINLDLTELKRSKTSREGSEDGDGLPPRPTPFISVVEKDPNSTPDSSPVKNKAHAEYNRQLSPAESIMKSRNKSLVKRVKTMVENNELEPDSRTTLLEILSGAISAPNKTSKEAAPFDSANAMPCDSPHYAP